MAFWRLTGRSCLCLAAKSGAPRAGGWWLAPNALAAGHLSGKTLGRHIWCRTRQWRSGGGQAGRERRKEGQATSGGPLVGRWNHRAGMVRLKVCWLAALFATTAARRARHQQQASIFLPMAWEGQTMPVIWRFVARLETHVTQPILTPKDWQHLILLF